MFFLKVFFTFLLCFAFSIFAFEIPNPDGFVLDNAQIISSSEEQILEDRLLEFEKDTSIEVAILTIENLGSESISQLAFDIGEKWGVGKKEKDNGMFILISKNDRSWFIAVGYGLEEVITDAIAKRIGEANFPVNFREGKYFDGINSVLDDLLGYLSGDDETITLYKKPSNSDSLGLNIFIVFFIGGFFGSILRGMGLKSKNIFFIFLILEVILVFLLLLTGSNFLSIFVLTIALSTGLLLYFFNKGGVGSSGSSGWGSSSGSGGFGGGSFGGGGAGGRW